ncbi:RloB family protein [Buchananella hordeovulneris]|uniref:RloB domain-containing protein n=1 Tax=Buchananella hordeovulneris TaxID=52770 RepID=A0A1Q5PUX8_9ACTO|nr:RloB family protein [Buchananella hordeovulneris]MDO5080018.1 RloB family protein [Buchananella hordeovulneris]OKL51235.1 hypothetical protein BSZ40_07935 [Buchananella hordeovulneris]
MANGLRGKRRRRIEKRRILVVTEGMVTEPDYLEKLQQELRDATVFLIVKPVGRDPLTVVRKAEELAAAAEKKGKGYDAVYCLVDVDRHEKLAVALKRADRLGIHVLVSNLKFEVWLLWHVSDRVTEMNSTELDREMKNHGLLEEKRLSSTFRIGGYDEACRRARQADPDYAAGRVGPNPSTALPVLIEKMRPPSS